MGTQKIIKDVGKVLLNLNILCSRGFFVHISIWQHGHFCILLPLHIEGVEGHIGDQCNHRVTSFEDSLYDEIKSYL